MRLFTILGQALKNVAEMRAIQTQINDEKDGMSTVFHKNGNTSIVNKIGNTTMLFNSDGSTQMFSKIGNNIIEF